MPNFERTIFCVSLNYETFMSPLVMVLLYFGTMYPIVSPYYFHSFYRIIIRTERVAIFEITSCVLYQITQKKDIIYGYKDLVDSI